MNQTLHYRFSLNQLKYQQLVNRISLYFLNKAGNDKTANKSFIIFCVILFFIIIQCITRTWRASDLLLLLLILFLMPKKPESDEKVKPCGPF